MGIFRILALIFTIVPLIELILFKLIGDMIGFPVTIGTILLTGLLGAWLTKRQGFRTLANYQKALSELRLPHREVVDGILILLAGALLLTPGFLTDIVGFMLLLQQVRDKVRSRLIEKLKTKFSFPGVPPEGSSQKAPRDEVIIIESEVIDEKVK